MTQTHDNDYFYVLVRKDLPLEHQLIQSVHATHEVAQGDPHDSPLSVVVCEVESEEALIAFARKLDKTGCEFVLFREPDRDNEATALATKAVSGEGRRPFKKCKLWDPTN